MYCSKCGTKAIDGAAFCQKCGAKLIQDNREKRDSVPVHIRESMEKPIPSVGTISESEQKSVKEEESILVSETIQALSTKPVEKPAISVEAVQVPPTEAVEASGDEQSDFYSSEAFRRNEKSYGSTIKPYYCEQFNRIDSGQKSKFNWAAFLLGGCNMLYNGCNKLFCMTFLPLSVVGLIGQLLNALGEVSSDSSAVNISLIMNGMVLLCYFVLSIVNGLKFNTWYYQDVTRNPEKQRNRKGLWIYLVSASVASMVICAIPYVVTPSYENLYDDFYENLSEGFSNEDLPNIELSQTYINEEEGFSFRYPLSWQHLSETDFAIRKELLGGDSLILEIYSLDDLKYGESYYASYMQVLKTPVNLTFQGTIDDFQREISESMDDGEVIGLSDIELDGFPARKLSYLFNDTGQTCAVVEYYYVIDDIMYIIRFYTFQGYFNKYEPLFNAIIDSYSITDANTSGGNGISNSSNIGEILYKGIPLGSLFEGSAVQAAEILGLPSGWDRDDDVRLYISEIGEVESIEIWNIGALTLNGETLEKNRDGLAAILGEPVEEGGSSGEYFVRYLLRNCSLYFELGEWDAEAWRVTIYSVQSDAAENYVSHTMCYEDDTNSYLELYPNGTFCLFANLYEAVGTVIGRYRSNYSGYEFNVTARTFSGFAGDDVEGFEMVIDGSTLKYSGDWIGTVSEGSVFRLYACDDESTVYDSVSVFYDDADLPVLGYGLEWVEAPAIVTDDYGNIFISGVVRNTYGSSRSVVNIYFALWDADEYQISPAIDMIYNFRNGDEWCFNAAVDKNAAYWDFSYVSAY